jgi:ribosomal protein L37AE/L43A
MTVANVGDCTHRHFVDKDYNTDYDATCLGPAGRLPWIATDAAPRREAAGTDAGKPGTADAGEANSKTKGEAMTSRKPKGICDGCGNSPRALTQIESGQWVCQTCLREIRGPRRPQNLATLEQVAQLRQCGFMVSDDLTRAEYRRLHWIHQLRSKGVPANQDAALEDLDRLEKIFSLRAGGANLPYSATASQAEEALSAATRVRHFFSPVAGVTFENVDGTSRQRIIARCNRLEQLVLVHEEENQFDPNAMAVKRDNGEQLGYLPADLAETVANDHRRGYRYGVMVAAITGGTKDFPALGCKLLIIVSEPGVSDGEAIGYINRVIASDKEIPDELGVNRLAAAPIPEKPPRETGGFWKRLFG